ncbi:hypothetical protein BA065_01140 [Nanoarchaeota archaeon NZ13-N]|nr:MAG: hypothetical protein BA065_01140 [Nanoarchaeota archaeon NZ13-N]
MRRGQVGVGELLIFLATIVVAVVAAVVFITTATNLQQKAFAVGSEARERVSATVDVESITGYKGSGTATYDSKSVDRFVENITLVIKLAPGAEPIKLDDEATTLQVLTPSWQSLAIRLGGFAASSTSGETWPSGFYSDSDLNNALQQVDPEKFYVWVNQSVNRDEIWQVLSPGELYTLVVPLNKNSSHILPEETEVVVKFVSRTGISTTLKFRTPSVIKDPIILLYP